MIFVTVGGQMPFDRLVTAVDDWAGRSSEKDIFAQIGSSALRPCHLRWAEFLKPAEFEAHVRSARFIVAHAGMGSILSALDLRKPIIVMPRLGSLGETRNDHQVATARRLSEFGYVSVAMNEEELHEQLESHCHAPPPAPEVRREVAQSLVSTIRNFLDAVREGQHPRQAASKHPI